MRKFMTIAIGAALLAGAPFAASAQMGPPGDRRDTSEPDRRPGADRPGPDRPGNGPDRDRPGNGPGRNDDQYGRWESGWGNRPPPPPKHFSRHGSWYQHVRACSERYRSYNPRTDTYQVRPGVRRICRL